jgi:hypothetical protein
MSKHKSKLKDKWKVQEITVQDNTGEIITKPNQSMSVREILFRNTQGMTYDNYKTPYYEDQATFSSQSLNKIQEMEPVEKLQYLKNVSSQVKSLEKQIKDHETAKQEALIQASQEAVVDTQTNKETKSE